LPNSIEQGIDLGQSFIAGRQNIEYYGIKDMDVLIEDTSPMSSQYFKVIKFPNQIEGGKNALFLLGDSEMLEKGSEILIEVLDANGDNIFVETTEYGEDRLWVQTYSQTIADAKGGKRCIAIWLQSDAAPGIGKILIAGIAARTPDERPIQGHPNPEIAKYADQYNVRWTKDVVVEPFRPNSSELIYLDYDRRKYNSYKDANAISASLYEATWSYSYITSDNNSTLSKTIYYSMSSAYNTKHHAFEADGVSPNPLAGERIPGWKEGFDANYGNCITIGVQTGSGRQVGYEDPDPTWVWGQATDGATKNVSQSLPTPFGDAPYTNGAGINVQVDNYTNLADDGIISAYGFGIDGKSMWRLMASHSFWQPNESHSVGEYIYRVNESGGPYIIEDSITADYYYPYAGLFGDTLTFGPAPIAPMSVSKAGHSNTGWADFVRPGDFATISEVVDDGSGIECGWREYNLGGGAGDEWLISETDGGDIYGGLAGLGGMINYQAYMNFGLIKEYFGNDMTGKTNAPIWTRFSASRHSPFGDDAGSGTGATQHLHENSVKFAYSQSSEPPTETGASNNPYKGANSYQRAFREFFEIDKIGSSDVDQNSVYKGGYSPYSFYWNTQKIHFGTHIYNSQGTNAPSTMVGVNALPSEGGINAPVANFGGQPSQDYQQKWMLWYKPQYDYQTIPFRGEVDPSPSEHGKNQVKIKPYPWSFIFTRSAMVHSQQYTDYYTNGVETGTITLDGGLPYFDGEMAGDGFAQGIGDFDNPWTGGPFGPTPPPPPPPPPPGGGTINKIQLPNHITFLFYDNGSSTSTFANNFYVGNAISYQGQLQPDYNCDITNPDSFNDEFNTFQLNGSYYTAEYCSFMNEWVNAGLHVSLSYAQQPQQYEVNNIVSYLNFRITNFQPITGDVYKVKVYKRPKSGLKSWEFLDDVVVERTELLRSESTSRPISPIGFFDQQETIDNNWYTGSGTYLTHFFPDTDDSGNPIPQSTSLQPYDIPWRGITTYTTENNPNAFYPPFPTASISDSLVLGSIIPGMGADLVSQSWDNVTAQIQGPDDNGLLYYPNGYSNYSAPLNGDSGNLKPGKCRSFYDFHHLDGITLSTNRTYELSFIANAKQYGAFQTGSDGAPSGHNPACMHVYMSGSSFPTQHEQDPLRQHNFGRYVRTYFIHPDQAADGLVKSFGKQYAYFQTNELASNNRLRFIITGGQWVLSEISIKDVEQTGFTPSDFGFQVKLGTEQFGEFMDFKLEMYNWYGLKANKDLYLPNYFIQGGNTYTNNLNDVNQGNTFIGNVPPAGDNVVGMADSGISIFGADPNGPDVVDNNYGGG